MAITNFTVNYDLLASNTDSSDEGVDADIIPLIGSVLFEPVTADDRAVLAPSYSPRPAGFKLRSFTGFIDVDGRLKSARSGAVGVRLWANDPVLELERLTYKVTFSLTTPVGEQVRVDGGYFEAPETDVAINLANVLQSTGLPSPSVLQQQLVYSNEIVDSTAIGQGLMTAATAAAARTTLGATATGSSLIIAADSAAARTAIGPGGVDFIGKPTTIKTAAYAAAVGDIVRADATAGGFTVTLPAAPAADSTVWVKKIDATTNTVTVQRGNGTDVFNETNGPSLLYLAVPGESVQVQYRSGIWYVVSHSFTVPGLDKRYVKQSPYPAANSYSIDDLNGASVLAISGTENAAVHWEANNASAAGSPILKLRAQGSSPDVWVSLQPKGAGAVIMYDSEGGQVAQFYRPSASPVNSWRFDNSPTGVALKCYAQGSNSDVSLNFIPKGTGTVVVDSGLTLADAATLAVGTSTGSKIATATTQKLGFWNATPAVQPTAVADATDAASVITQLNALLSRLRTIGLIAT